jgi:hypothetical protein
VDVRGVVSWAVLVREHLEVTGRTRAICELGHVVDVNVVDPDEGLADSSWDRDRQNLYGVDRFCQECGSPVLFACPACQVPIATLPGVSLADRRAMPFCGACGEPMPWATRKDRAVRMKALLGGTGVDEVHRLAAAEAIDELAAADPDDDEAQAKAAGNLKRLLGRGFDLVLPVAQSLMTAAAKEALGLH